MQSISFPGSRVVFGRRRLGAGKDWPLRCPQRFDPQLKKIKENVVEHARLFFYIFNLKSKASHTYCLCYFQEVVIGLTEHSRLYVNNKEVGSFFSFIVIKYLMTGPNGNSEFCFPKTHNIPRGEAEENISPNSKLKKKNEKMIFLTPLHTLAAFAKLRDCQNQSVVSKNHDNS